MKGLDNKIEVAKGVVTSFLEGVFKQAYPDIAVVLGSGLSSFGERLTFKQELPYKEIPGFPVSTVPGHEGKLLAGFVKGVPVIVWAGRTHYYEGRSLNEVTFYVRLTKALGIRTLFLSNAAGGIQQDLAPGDLMVIHDHINMMGVNPLRGPEYQFIDMSQAYDPEYIEILVQIAASQGISLKRGVYVATMGPSYETPAEVRAFATLGGSAVGMSTVPEVIVARSVGLKVAAVSCITNYAAGLSSQPLSHEEVKEVALKAEKAFGDLVEAFIVRIRKEE